MSKFDHVKTKKYIYICKKERRAKFISYESIINSQVTCYESLTVGQSKDGLGHRGYAVEINI